jgi:hypothetical protein
VAKPGDMATVDPGDDTVAVISPSGVAGTIKRSQLPAAIQRGYRYEAPAATRGRDLERRYGDAPVRTALESGFSTATFGISDGFAALGEGGEAALAERQEGLRERRSRNQVASAVGTVAGAINPFGAGGLAVKGGAAVAGKVAATAGKGLKGRATAAAAGGATEGAILGSSTAAGELAISEDPITAERALETFGSHVLLGGGVGAGVGAGARILGAGAKAVKEGRAAKAAAKAAEQADAAAAPGAVPAELATKPRQELVKLRQTERAKVETATQAERKALIEAREAEKTAIVERSTKARSEAKAAKQAELERLGATRSEEGLAIAQDVKATVAKPRDYFLAVDDPAARKVLMKAHARVRGLGDNVEALKDNPRRALDAFQQRKQALSEFLERDADRILQRAETDDLVLAGSLPRSQGQATQLTGEHARAYRAWANVKGKKGERGVLVEPAKLDEFREALQSGTASSTRRRGVDAAREQLAADEAMITRIKAWAEPPTSPKLAQLDEIISSPIVRESDELAKISAKLEELSARGKTSEYLQQLENAIETYGERNASTVATEAADSLASSGAGVLLSAMGVPAGLAFPIASRIGDAAASILKGGSLGQVARSVSARVAQSADRVEKAVETFLRAGARAARTAPAVSTRVLGEVSYASPAATLPQVPATRAASSGVTAYRQRERELLSQVEPRPEGGYKIRMTAAREIHERMAGLWALSPKLADAIEAAAIKRLEFVASKLPERPPATHMRVGPESWQPSDSDLSKFARYVDAAEGGPSRILGRLGDGTITPEDAETLRELYPETYREVQMRIMDGLAEMTETMPYPKRLALGILFDVPTDPALEPANLAQLQGNFAMVPPDQSAPPAMGMQQQQGSASKLKAPDPTQAQGLSA